MADQMLSASAGSAGGREPAGADHRRRVISDVSAMTAARRTRDPGGALRRHRARPQPHDLLPDAGVGGHVRREGSSEPRLDPLQRQISVAAAASGGCRAAGPASGVVAALPPGRSERHPSQTATAARTERPLLIHLRAINPLLMITQRLIMCCNRRLRLISRPGLRIPSAPAGRRQELLSGMRVAFVAL